MKSIGGIYALAWFRRYLNDRKQQVSFKGHKKRVSMGLTDRRKTTKNLFDSRKNWKILTVSHK